MVGIQMILTDDNSFQMFGAATDKACLPRLRIVLGT